MKVVAIVGMAGAGKSEAARIFEEHGFTKVRFGDLTDRELEKMGMERNEENERYVRQQLRERHGIAAYAMLNQPRIDSALESSAVVIDGLYSWEEYTLLKERYGERFAAVVIWASPATRYRRLTSREVRPLTIAEAAARDRSEIERSNKGGPIAMADLIILNEASLEEMERQTRQVISDLR
jgi:dephospho-CoA kinase